MIRIFLFVVPFFFSTLVSSTVHADIRIWRTTANTDGNLGARAGADAFCDGDVNKPNIAGSATRAYLSVSSADEIRDMAALYSVPSTEAVFRKDGTTQIASNFAALLNGNSVALTNSINGVGGIAGAAFTGSTDVGALDANNCSGFSGTTGNGMSGLGNSTTGGHLNTGVTGCSNAVSIGLFCITYTAPLAATTTAKQVPIFNPWLLLLLSMVFAGSIYRKTK